jgi:thioredoxin reductase (NADPH)
MDTMRKQAQRVGSTTIYKTIIKVDFSKKPFELFSDDNSKYTADTVIIATGASARYLGLPSEKHYMGSGVSACATCDGFFFRNQKVVVVGGGDTAMEEASYLANICSEVTLIHRREGFRASPAMLDRVKRHPKIKFALNSVIEEICGKEGEGRKMVTSVLLKNVKTNEYKEHECEGVFIAIGHDPNTNIFRGILELDPAGYIITEKSSTKTNINGVFACGDAQDSHYRQAITAAGTGCMAAKDAEDYLEMMD